LELKAEALKFSSDSVSFKDNTIPTYIYDAFSHWKVKHNKTYETESEENFRASAFNSNYNIILSQQPKTGSYRLGLNKFADLTTIEFKRQYLATKISTKEDNQRREMTKKNLNIPSSKDWVAEGAVTPIKNQGQCGSCWSFSVSGALEGLNVIKGGALETYSEQQMMDCSKDLGNESCQGGYMDKAYDYVQSKGVESEGDYPYIAVDRNTCNWDQSKVKFTIDGHEDVPIDDNDALKTAISQVPVSVAISGEQIQFYVDGIWDYWLCFTEVDHGVLAVGYDTANDGTMYWKVKNSWGEDWGENGYIKFARRDGQSVGMCGITKQASYPIKN